jgi:hypothetical protein
MTTLTMRYMRGDYVVTGPDIKPVKFKSRREARDWCAQNHRVEPAQRDRRLMLRSASVLTANPMSS